MKTNVRVQETVDGALRVEKRVTFGHLAVSISFKEKQLLVESDKGSRN